MPSEVRVRLAREPAELETCLRLRWTVFIEELQERPSTARDALDRLAEPGEALPPLHCLAELLSPAGQPVPAGAGRVSFGAAGTARIERLAVIDDARRQGVGRELLGQLERAARGAGASRLLVQSGPRAQGFFERHGYRTSAPATGDRLLLEKAFDP